MKITQKELDKLADILWWIKGYMAGAKDNYESCPFNEEHINSISKIREYVMDQQKNNNNKPPDPWSQKMSKQLYYMQDNRQYVGNSMSWWAKDGRGYTCDIRKAHIFTIGEAKNRSQRSSDVLWPKEYIDKRISHHIDMQHCEREIAKAFNMEEYEKL